MINIIVAASQNNVIGAKGSLPWHLPGDMKFFKNMTSGQVVLMGRKTFDSLPAPFKPLPNRFNVVVSTQQGKSQPGALWVTSIDEGVGRALAIAREMKVEVFVIGGGEIYRQCLDHADTILMTCVEAEIDGDTFFPKLDDKWELRHWHIPDDDRASHSYHLEIYGRRECEQARRQDICSQR